MGSRAILEKGPQKGPETGALPIWRSKRSTFDGRRTAGRSTRGRDNMIIRIGFWGVIIVKL